MPRQKTSKVCPMPEDSPSNEALVKKLYEGLKNLDSHQMNSCYHSQATFEDPVFGKLDAKETKAMWQMLCSRAKDFSLEIDKIECDSEKGKGSLVAKYTFSPTGRRVENHIESEFTFKNGKILEQRDHFSLWKWTRQAVGVSGWLFGWLPNFRSKKKKKVKRGLHQFMDSR